MTHTKFIDARFFADEAAATIEERLGEFLRTFRKNKMASAMATAGQHPRPFVPLKMDDYGDDLMSGAL